MSFRIILVSLFLLLLYINFCSGYPGAGIPPQYNTPCEEFPIKSDCLRVYCVCGWCENINEKHDNSELPEKGISKKREGTCFTYDDDPDVNIKNCGSPNVTIHTYVNSRYCKNLYKVGYILGYIVLGFIPPCICILCICAVVCFMHDLRLSRHNRVNAREMSMMNDL